jgi:hypothetical protein
MSEIRITRKLKESISVLADERNADCSDEAFVIALRKGKLKPQDVYKALAVMRYSWNAKRGYWIWKPRRLKSIKRVFSIVRKIEDSLFVESQ